MGTTMFGCGCFVIRSMFGEREVAGLGHCWQHVHLYSQDKTPRQMATEIEAEPDHMRRERPWPYSAEGAYA